MPRILREVRVVGNDLIKLLGSVCDGMKKFSKFSSLIFFGIDSIVFIKLRLRRFAISALMKGKDLKTKTTGR
jgi:hypothetical protein